MTRRHKIRIETVAAAQTPSSKSRVPAVNAGAMALCDIYFALPSQVLAPVMSSFLISSLAGMADPMGAWEYMKSRVDELLPKAVAASQAADLEASGG